MDSVEKQSNNSTTKTRISGGRRLFTENTKAKNKEALLTAGMGYGRKKQQTLAAFWSVVWPGLEGIGWKRIDGQGKNEGSIIFLPPNVKNPNLGKRNVDYYDKIRFVVDRLEERRNVDEGKILDLFRSKVRSVSGEMKTSRPKRSSTSRPRLGVSRQSRKSQEIDTSWKDGRNLFPRRSSQVGLAYQVSFLPHAGSIETEKQLDKPKYELSWSSEKAAKMGVLSFIEDNVPQNKKEKALELLHKNNYSIVNTADFMNQLSETSTSNWTEEEREKFRIEIFRTRKNFKALCQSMGNKKMGDIIAYYLGHYKKSNDYRLLKTVRMEERREKSEQSIHDVDQCAICGEGGNLLICDGCESEWHMKCTRPPLKAVPEGRWECDVCVDRKFLEARNHFLQTAKSNMSLMNSEKNEKQMSLMNIDNESEGLQKSDARSTNIHANVLEALRTFSRNIDSILTKQSTILES